MDKTYWVCELPAEVQEAIRENMEEMGFSGEDIDRAMNSKLNDIEEVW